MKITVISGTEKRGMTWRLKEMYLSVLRPQAQITEFVLPRDCPSFCSGCLQCILHGEQHCKDARSVQAIVNSLLEADLIVFLSPAYVMHITGAMKSLLDHLAYLWIPHRPEAAMFSKRAVIITQCIGSGAKSAAHDIRDSLSWWGISDITLFTARLMDDVIWENLSEHRRKALAQSIQTLANRSLSVDWSNPPRVRLKTRLIFMICRKMQQNLYRNQSAGPDTLYWYERGWLDDQRPWR